MDIRRLQRKTVTQEYLEKGSGDRNVDKRFQAELEENRGGITRHT